MNISYLYTNADFHEALKPLFLLMERPEYKDKVLIVKSSGADIYDKRCADVVCNTINYEKYANMCFSSEGEAAFEEAKNSVMSTVNALAEKMKSEGFWEECKRGYPMPPPELLKREADCDECY